MSRPTNKVAVIGIVWPEELFARDDHALQFAEDVTHYLVREAPLIRECCFLAAIIHVDLACIGIAKNVDHFVNFDSNLPPE